MFKLELLKKLLQYKDLCEPHLVKEIFDYLPTQYLNISTETSYSMRATLQNASRLIDLVKYEILDPVTSVYVDINEFPIKIHKGKIKLCDHIRVLSHTNYINYYNIDTVTPQNLISGSEIIISFSMSSLSPYINDSTTFPPMNKIVLPSGERLMCDVYGNKVCIHIYLGHPDSDI